MMTLFNEINARKIHGERNIFTVSLNFFVRHVKIVNCQCFVVIYRLSADEKPSASPNLFLILYYICRIVTFSVCLYKSKSCTKSCKRNCNACFFRDCFLILFITLFGYQPWLRKSSLCNLVDVGFRQLH